MPPRSAVLLLCASLTACGAAASTTTVRRRAARTQLPPTDRDPLPYTPPPSQTGRAGQTTALAAVGGEDQARRMLPALVDALRAAHSDGDRRLTGLFAEEVGLVASRHAGRPGRPRGPLIQRMMLYLQRSIVPEDTELADLFDLQGVRVSRASVFFRHRDLPSTVRPTDSVVVVPILGPGRIPMRTLMGWVGRAHLVVRPGREPRIVAY